MYGMTDRNKIKWHGGGAPSALKKKKKKEKTLTSADVSFMRSGRVERCGFL